MSHVTATNDEKNDQPVTETLHESQTTHIQVATSSSPAAPAVATASEESPFVTRGQGQEPNSKSSSTKSKKSKVSAVSSTNSLENGYGKHHQLLQDRSSQSSTSIILNQPHPPNSWIEQIQFKAQYCHFRCNDYVTVINSAQSLDKVEELALQQQLRAEQIKTKIIGQPSTSRQCSSQFNKGATTTSVSASVSPKPPLFCWNFPRVKLRRLFNAKSLDDITNSQLQGHSRGLKHKDGRSQSSTSHEIHSVLSRTAVLKDNTPISGPSHRIEGPQEIGSQAHPQQKRRQKKPRRSDEDTCSTDANLGASKLKPSSSSSSSENGATIFRTTRVIDGTGGLGMSATTTTTTTVEQSRKLKNDSQGHGHSTSRKQGSYFINCAKSDTCINNINRVHSSTPRTRIFDGPGAHAQHSSILVPCCSNPHKLVYNNEASKTTSVDNLDIVSRSHKANANEFQDSPVPETLVAEASSSTAPTSTCKKKTSFLKPVNKVNPIQTYTDDYEEVADEITMELPNSSASGATVKPKLVVTSVSYLQRPMSPNPNPHTPAQTSTTISVTPGVLLRKNHNDNDNDSTEPLTATKSKNAKSKPAASANDSPTTTTKEPATAAGASGAFSIKNYLGELIKEKCITKRTETKHVERVREKVKDKHTAAPANEHVNVNANVAKHGSKNVQTSSSSTSTTMKPEARSIHSPLEVFYDKLEKVEHYTSSDPVYQRQSRTSGTSSSVTSPDSGTDDNKRGGKTDHESKMSDLQSPHYVKKTASMFNSKMDSASSMLHRTTAAVTNTTGTSTTTLGDPNQYYASSFLLPITTESNSSAKDGNVRHIAIERNGNGASPSYLNVSKSVSGYHGLAYNSAASEKSNGHLLNGSSGLKSACGGANGTLRTQINSPPQYTSPHKASFMIDGYDVHHADNGGDQAPPLPKTCPPLSSPSLVNTNSSSSYKRVANSSSSAGNDFYEESSEKHHLISQSQRNYKLESGYPPSNKPAVPEKSRVLEQIQKLYGDQQVTANTPGVLFRRHYSPQRTSESSNANTGKVTTIPIQCTNLSTGKENNTRNIVINKSQERIIPIAVDPYLQESTRAPSDMRNKTTQGYERYEKEERVYEGVNLKSSPGPHNLFEFEKYSNTNEVNFNTTANSNSNTSSSKTDLTNNVGKINGSSISQINIHRDSADKNIHKTSITIPINVQQNNGTSNSNSNCVKTGSHSSHFDNHTEKCKPMSSNLISNDTVDTTSYSIKSVVTNSVSSAPKSSNIKIIPVQVQNDLGIDNHQHQSSATPTPTLTPRENNMEGRRQPIANTLNKENDFPTAAVVKDGNYFLQEVQNEKARIQKLISTATEKLEELDTSSEESGRVRAAIGKANLLINKKFKQFEGLCQTNIKEQSQGTSDEPFTTQNDDLAGFWDMVLIQVDQIHQMFLELDPRQQKSSRSGNANTSSYQRTALVPRKDVLKKVGSPTKSTPVKQPTTTSSTPNARDEMRRKMIAERRKAMKNAGDGTNGTTSEPDVQIFVPESQS